MHSDEWLRLGYTSSEQIAVSDVAYYRIWHDNAGNEIGATVDFETADDFHYELPLAEWQSFLSKILCIGKSDDLTTAFREYFVKNKGLFDFERDLRICGIVYQKFFF